ncbi:NAD-dependent epimerase/dehydratase [Ephemerocybe angulata]|uniref:NAD-dependent epimerase/dehydratase n=1 Tax=Ephemerocybe angulata TaxID=980116 RepID=A0A8H6HTV6_9AGAR|nr:NAD-dependent epimerase/dehydratase [Tulosesus angulatus]
MGGMGTIHPQNDFDIYTDNHMLTLALLRACIAAGVKGFFYASSACVYPEHLQQSTYNSDSDSDVSLKEEDAFACPQANAPPQPQGLYGLEKLNTELLLAQFKSPLDIRIARFHNVYGPGGTYMGGREKAPAALLRKAAALTLLSPSDRSVHPDLMHMELWGDGSQRRSFLYIDDAVDGILRLLRSDYTCPLNIGSDTSISIHDLCTRALECANIDPSAVEIKTIVDRPVGVGCRNSDNTLVKATLHWAPTVSIEEGMRRTYTWIHSEIRQQLEALPEGAAPRVSFVQQLQSSEVIDLSSNTVSFAILLPITSRSKSAEPSHCLENLEKFAKSLIRTTRDDLVLGEPFNGGTTRFEIRIYLAVDHDDDYLLLNRPEDLLRRLGLTNVKTQICNHPKGHVCALWRDCARSAWTDECDYFVLLGDDVEMLDNGWMRRVHDEFLSLAHGRQVPVGVGCIAFTDTSFPGMPTFPVVHRRHMDTFNGEVVPDIFINQDGDPFLFQLYRRWSCSKMIDCRVSNAIGGSVEARYEKSHAKGWTFETLDNAVARLAETLYIASPPTITLDIVVPCYRVDPTLLTRILELDAPPTLSVMFVIIVDDPNSPNIIHLERLFNHRVDVRIRVNKSNLGASASRNRGMLEESAADWVHFLDDDIVPDPNLLFEVEKVIRAHPTAAGFVGNCQFPVACTMFQAAAHLAGVTYFWDIATKMDTDLPWGVTANLIFRRKNDGVEFDLRYPKTGGGEDIDFCMLKREASIKSGGGQLEPAPKVIVTHPWWSEGKRSYWRFYMWSIGDGALVKRFPEATYGDWAPNTPEAAVVIISIFLACFLQNLTLRNLLDTVMGLGIALLALLVANVIHDLYRYLVRHPERMRELKLDSKFRGGPWLWAALVEGTFIRIFSECGRLRGVVTRKEWDAFGRRFDWFAGRWGKGPRNEERRNNVERVALWLVVWGRVRFDTITVRAQRCLRSPTQPNPRCWCGLDEHDERQSATMADISQ